MAIKRKPISTIIEAQQHLASISVIRENDGRGPIRRLYAGNPTTSAIQVLTSNGFTEEEIGKKYNISEQAFEDFRTSENRKAQINKKVDAKHNLKPHVPSITENQLDEIIDCIEMLRELVISLKHPK